MKLQFFIVSLLLSPVLYGQSAKKLSLEVNYGINGNFFVRDYDESIGPVNGAYLYNKNFLGTISGSQLTYNFSTKSGLFIAYSRSQNMAKRSFDGEINGVDVIVNDFRIRHIVDLFQIGYERRIIGKKATWNYHAGVVLGNSSQQEISLERDFNLILIDERTVANSGLSEGGIFAGMGYSLHIDKRWEIGIKIRGYYFISYGEFESISLTPTLAYHF